MNKVTKLISKRLSLLSLVFVIVASVVIFFLSAQFIFKQDRIVGDTATHLMLAVAPLIGNGSPYRDVWEIKPPVWPMLLYGWSSLFGFGIVSIRILNLVVSSVIVFFTLAVFKKVFSTPVYEFLFVCAMVVVLSPILNSIMLSTEIVGLAISLVGLWFLLRDENSFGKYYLAGVFLFAASQTKEPFTFGMAAIVPILVWLCITKGITKFVSGLFGFLLGAGTTFSAIYLYLYHFGSIAGYLEVFKFKQLFFTYEKLLSNFLPGYYIAARTFVEYPSILEILLVISLLIGYLVNRYSNKLYFDKSRSELKLSEGKVLDIYIVKNYTVLFYSLGSFVGFGLGGSFGSHYLIQVVIPFYMIIGLVMTSIFNNLGWLVTKNKLYIVLTLLMGGLLFLIALPKRPYVSSLLHRNLKFNYTDQVFSYEKRIGEITTKDKCILSVYGWGVSENYIYTLRRPCTRFVLANMVSLVWQYKEYAKSIQSSPPAAIIYQTAGADMNIGRFESEVINIKKIVKNCYVQDTLEKVIFVPKSNDLDKLKTCIVENSN